MIMNGDYQVEISSVQHLKMLQEMRGFANLFFAQYWRVVLSQIERKFITSDNPVSEFAPPRQGIYGATFLERTYHFPLSPDMVADLPSFLTFSTFFHVQRPTCPCSARRFLSSEGSSQPRRKRKRPTQGGPCKVFNSQLWRMVDASASVRIIAVVRQLLSRNISRISLVFVNLSIKKPLSTLVIHK